MKEFFNSLKPKSISVYKSLSKNDYVKIAIRAVEWAILGYAIPVLNGVSAFSWVSFGTAAGTGLSVGIEKAIKLYFTNSNGEVAEPENDKPITANPVVK